MISNGLVTPLPRSSSPGHPTAIRGELQVSLRLRSEQRPSRGVPLSACMPTAIDASCKVQVSFQDYRYKPTTLCRFVMAPMAQQGAWFATNISVVLAFGNFPVGETLARVSPQAIKGHESQVRAPVITCC